MRFDCFWSLIWLFSSCIQEPCTLNEVQYLAHKDALSVTWFHNIYMYIYLFILLQLGCYPVAVVILRVNKT